MSHICCTSNLVVNENQTASFTIELCDVSYKTLQSVKKDPETWLRAYITNKIDMESNRIYEYQLNKHLTNSTMPANATKKSLILSYEPDPTTALPP